MVTRGLTARRARRTAPDHRIGSFRGRGGTQDSSGIEKIKEAINSIQDDFEKIFIITHLEELKDSFPVTINVYKTSSGSTISIN